MWYPNYRSTQSWYPYNFSRNYKHYKRTTMLINEVKLAIKWGFLFTFNLTHVLRNTYYFCNAINLKKIPYSKCFFLPLSIMKKVCRPRFKEIYYPGTSYERRQLIGGCFVTTNGFEDFSEFSPCSSDAGNNFSVLQKEPNQLLFNNMRKQ